MIPAIPSVVSTPRPKLPTSTALRVDSSASGTGVVPIRAISAVISETTSAAVWFLVCVRAAMLPVVLAASTLLPAPYARPRLIRTSWFSRDEKPPPSTVLATAKG